MMGDQFTNLKNNEIMLEPIVSNQDITVDIIVIGRNEGDLLEKALNSAKASADEYKSYGNSCPRIIYVDGQSTDGSADLAKKMGIEVYIVEGKPNPAKGRHLGFTKSKAKYIFFLDGDMEIYRGWLIQGISYLETHGDIAGVSGILDWEDIENGQTIGRQENYWGVGYNGEKVRDNVGGAFIYRRNALLESGDFNPEMIRCGELELYLRLVAKGYRLVRIVVPMAVHRDCKTSQSGGFLRRYILTKNMLIPGVVVRMAPRSLFVWFLIIQIYWMYLWHPIAVTILFISIFKFAVGNSISWLICGLIVFIILLTTHFLYKAKKWRRAIVSMITINFYCIGFIVGFISGYPKLEIYSRNTRNI